MKIKQDQVKEYLDIATDAATLGGAVLTKYWQKPHQITEKEYSSSLVTEADKESEEKIIAYLTKKTPDFGILAEESGMYKLSNSEFLWIIDPLDGTTNYAHHYPFFCVSIGLVCNQEPIAGVIFDPIHSEMFLAAKDLGATLNGKKIGVTKTKHLNKSLLVTGFAYSRVHDKDTNYEQFSHMTHITQGVRRDGAAALDLAYVAAGRFDGYWERGVSPWDMAAGVCLVKEARGIVTSYNNDPFDISEGKVVATNGFIHNELVEEIARAFPLL